MLSYGGKLMIVEDVILKEELLMKNHLTQGKYPEENQHFIIEVQKRWKNRAKYKNWDLKDRSFD